MANQRAPRALTGLRVLEVGQGVAAAYCTKLLAEHGAEVIKVERPDGDPVRRAGPFRGDRAHREAGGVFLYLNAGKRSITLNLKTATGRGILGALATTAAAVVTGVAPSALDRLGLAYPRLSAANPRLVQTAITSFGLDGPARTWAATELTAQAVSGLMHLTGDAEHEPLRYSQAQVQQVAGVNAAVSTLIALAGAQATGEGQLVDVSLYESIAAFYYLLPAQYSFMGAVVRRGVNDLYRCRDGYLVASPGAGRTWSAYAEFLGAPELNAPEFSSPSARARHQPELRAIIEQHLAARSPAEWFHAAQAERYPWGMLQTIAELAACPQLAAREFFDAVDHPVAGRFPMPGAPARLTATPWARPSELALAPRLGADNAGVLGGLGFNKAEMVRLRRAGVI